MSAKPIVPNKIPRRQFIAAAVVLPVVPRTFLDFGQEESFEPPLPAERVITLRRHIGWTLDLLEQWSAELLTLDRDEAGHERRVQGLNLIRLRPQG